MAKIIRQGNFDTLTSNSSNTGATAARRVAPDVATPSTSYVSDDVTLTVRQVANGRIARPFAGSTFNATLPTAAELIAGMNLKGGNYFDFIVDNTEQPTARSIFLVLGAGITEAIIVPAGGNLITGPANSGSRGMGMFRFIVAEDELGIIISRIF